MCGIWALIEKHKLKKEDLVKSLSDFWNIKHRGPDNSHLQTFDKLYVGFHRLAIMDTSVASNQPYILNDSDRTIVFVCNGEIYNFSYLDKKYNLNINKSDCLTIPSLYIKLGQHKWLELFNHEIKGEFAFMLFEFDNMNRLAKYFIGRDMVGIRPLYTVVDNIMIDRYSSEIKGLTSYQGEIKEFEPGTIKIVSFDSFDYKHHSYDFNSIYNKTNYIDNIHLIKNDNLDKVRTSVVESVRRRLVADRPIAFLLSGGVDSSLIAAISTRILGQPIKTFCCGIKGSTDMKYAKMVAEHIGSIHTEVYFTEEEGLELIDDVIYTTETWDTTTIRASVGQYIVSRYIALNTDCKVLLVGEGPDEVCSSYLFNYYAPSAKELHDTAEEYVKKIHMYDGRRADRCIARWGLEARIPLLDPEFISAYWEVDARKRLPSYNMEKYMFRKAFDRDNLLPDEILWRKKEAFSDGVSSREKSWYQVIQEYVEKQNNCNIEGMTAEASFYRNIFRKYFGLNRDNIIPHFWQPKWDKDGKEITSYVDPSARTLQIY